MRYRVIVVDDEYLVMEDELEQLRQCGLVSEAFGFTEPEEALAWLKGSPADIAFLDICMGDMTGLQLAARIRKLRPDVTVAFMTGYTEYALDAWNLGADGYILKPVTSEALNDWMNRLEQKRMQHVASGKLLKVRCFGSFEVCTPDGRPVIFTRDKAKEMLAYLVNRLGTGCTTRELADALFGDTEREESDSRAIASLKNSLISTLRSAGAEKVLNCTYNRFAVDRDMLDCDYFRLLDGDPEAGEKFTGQFMQDYSWAELAPGWLEQQLSNGEAIKQ